MEIFHRKKSQTSTESVATKSESPTRKSEKSKTNEPVIKPAKKNQTQQSNKAKVTEKEENISEKQSKKPQSEKVDAQINVGTKKNLKVEKKENKKKRADDEPKTKLTSDTAELVTNKKKTNENLIKPVVGLSNRKGKVTQEIIFEAPFKKQKVLKVDAQINVDSKKNLEVEKKENKNKYVDDESKTKSNNTDVKSKKTDVKTNAQHIKPVANLPHKTEKEPVSEKLSKEPHSDKILKVEALINIDSKKNLKIEKEVHLDNKKKSIEVITEVRSKKGADTKTKGELINTVELSNKIDNTLEQPSAKPQTEKALKVEALINVDSKKNLKIEKKVHLENKKKLIEDTTELVRSEKETDIKTKEEPVELSNRTEKVFEENISEKTFTKFQSENLLKVEALINVDSKRNLKTKKKVQLENKNKLIRSEKETDTKTKEDLIEAVELSNRIETVFDENILEKPLKKSQSEKALIYDQINVDSKTEQKVSFENKKKLSTAKFGRSERETDIKTNEELRKSAVELSKIIEKTSEEKPSKKQESEGTLIVDSVDSKEDLEVERKIHLENVDKEKAIQETIELVKSEKEIDIKTNGPIVELPSRTEKVSEETILEKPFKKPQSEGTLDAQVDVNFKKYLKAEKEIVLDCVDIKSIELIESIENTENKTDEEFVEPAIDLPNKTEKVSDEIISEKSQSEDTLDVDFKKHSKAEKKEEDITELVKSREEAEELINPDIELSNETETVSNIMKEITHVRVLTLNDGEHTNSTLYRIEKNWILQFRLGPSLFGRKVSLYCNYPDSKDGRCGEFNRNRYYLLSFKQDEGCNNADDTALYTEIDVKIAGSFHYYFVYENATEPCPHGSGYFLVDPVLKYGDNETLPLNCIQCQTVLSKCLGPLTSWENKLRVAKESGYNMIHFTPVQELGLSNSAYSLSAQLKLNPTFNDGDKQVTFDDIENLTNKMRNEWKILSICDIVLNHTANETDWLEDHPESTYNCLNCPYMRPAYLLDSALYQFSMDIKKGFYETEGIPIEIDCEDHLNAIRHALHTKVLTKIKLQEMVICDVSKLISDFLESARKNPSTAQIRNPDRTLKLIPDPMFRRLSATVDMELALQLYNIYRSDTFDEDSRLKRCGEEFKKKLDELNQQAIDQMNENLNVAVENTIAGIRYYRVQNDGPKVKEISIKNPLSFRYFTDFGDPKSIEEHEAIMYGLNSKYLMAHNGWVMNADPMRNFADPDSSVYVRRELIAWGDSVKLRFGDKPEDSPFIWAHMKEYVEKTAKVFDGVRLDNCHSTPIPVAEYLLDCARKVRPDLYVVAELFTNSDNTDNIFVNRLGITSLIREAMSAWDSHEEGRLVYRYGGEPVGAFFQPHFRPLVPSIAHALFLDLTHDNPSPVEKRSVFDLLPSTALVNMACCASGSNRGYDELVNHHIHVVDENRQYTEWTNDESLANNDPQYVSYKSGIISAKRALNDLHFKLGKENFNQVYVDQVDADIVTVTRHCPDTHQSIILVAFTAFRHPNRNEAFTQRFIKPLIVEGVLDEIVLEVTLNHTRIRQSESKYSRPEDFIKHEHFINGLSEYEVDIKQHIQLVNSEVFELGQNQNSNVVQLNFKNFKPGSVVAIKVSLQKNVDESIKNLRKLMLSFSRNKSTDLKKIIDNLNLSDLNRALYRCNEEERDEGKGFGAYNIPNFGSLVYCGLQGFMSLLSNIRPNNDLGHPMCGNLRDGNWMIDYVSQRLQIDDGTMKLGNWIENNFKNLQNIPRYLVPSYFDVLITGVYMLLLERSYALLSDFVKNGSTFVKGLSLGTVQLAAVIKTATLPTLSPSLSAPTPDIKDGRQSCATLSAGLPHFSVGYMRSWGRDTFIALRGLFLLTGRYQDARYHILGYAACLRHGLIPNLLDGGNNSRFNCRDAVWWWLYCIKCYAEEAPNGIDILKDRVSRIYPTDDSPALEPGVHDQALEDVMQEALKIHFQGLSFRERNAGRQIDAHMSDKGFNNQIGIHPETGFVFGGNDSNCGTWMDKMGSSDKAGNRGKPATPRDGSAIELIGLSKSVISWLSTLYDANLYPYQGVERTSKTGTILSWSFKKWSEKIQNHFEQCFWIDTNKTQNEIRPDLVNKRGIYKDCYGASQEWTDFQLRCNFPIAMVTVRKKCMRAKMENCTGMFQAPELFDPKHAWIALQKAEKYLLGPLGMKTLDPEDWTYCGDYNNDDDSTNFKTAHGFNYHQGPEWVWPIGFFLRAKLKFADANGELAKTLAVIKVILSKHFVELQTSSWRGLPELTNSNGSYCSGSCRTQAWSMSCILEIVLNEHAFPRPDIKNLAHNVYRLGILGRWQSHKNGLDLIQDV
ncbi:hypothetical protein FQR65_LT11232 [Abscondita terminalis]|nr:hypothetical protein FQR65_LT11232 [Abscondita terminalis]